MRRQCLPICSVVVLLVASQLITVNDATAVIVYNTGEVHDINFPIDDTVEVWDGSRPTTLNLLSGANISGRLGIRDSSQLNLRDGIVQDHVTGYDFSQLAVFGGTIGGHLSVTENCQATVSGGTIKGGAFAQINSRISISGGNMQGIFEVWGCSQVSISGDAIVTDGISIEDEALVTISGGEIVYTISATDSSYVTIVGGEITSSRLTASNNAQIVIEGSGFNFPFGEITNLAGYLTGTLVSGDPISNNFEVSGDAKIVLVHAPVTTPSIHNATQDTYYVTIQDAVDDANDEDVIVVPADTYTGPGNQDIDFQGKAITVRSEDPNDPAVVATTIIDCNGTAADPHRAFYFHSSEDANSILEGFTIINGYGPNEPFSTTEYSAGGAIYCIGSSPTIRNCIFKDNYCDYWGGAVHCDNSRAGFSNCTFRENVSGDTGGGLYNRISTIKVANCLFTDNSADAGGGIYNIDGASTVRNTLFVGNSAAIAGGGLRNKRVNSTITNCIFFDNYCPAGGAIHNVLAENTTVSNCILWDNPDSEIEGDAEVTYCDVKGGWPGEGNIDADPCFADTTGGDYHLKSQAGRWDPDGKTWVVDDVTSPCIDAGDPSSSIGWELYPNGGIVNIGIYGGTQEASKSYFGGPVCQKPIVGDANGDCRVDFTDFVLMALHWCEDNNP